MWTNIGIKREKRFTITYTENQIKARNYYDRITIGGYIKGQINGLFVALSIFDCVTLMKLLIFLFHSFDPHSRPHDFQYLV